VRKSDEGFCCSFNTLPQSQNLDISQILGQVVAELEPRYFTDSGTVGQVIKKSEPRYFTDTGTGNYRVRT
jgi:hypothetical protein